MDRTFCSALVGMLLFSIPSRAVETNQWEVIRDIEYARLGELSLNVDPLDPPLLLLHGDQDPQMPINQSHELFAAYKKVNAPVQFEVVHGAAHGGSAFHDAQRLAVVKKFLRRYF